MPTARELLEQADALMRRNRALADDDIPLLTDAVPSTQETQSHVAPPLRPVVAPAFAPGFSDDVQPINGKADKIDIVATDNALDEGEPSVWLDFQESEPSVIDNAPDSIAMVPPVDLHQPPYIPGSAEIEDLDALDDELAAAIAAAPREDGSLQPSAVAEPVAELVAEAVAEPEPVAEMPPPMPDEALPRAPEVIAGGAAALLHRVAAVLPVVAGPVVSVPSQVVAAPPATTPAVPDSAHWEAVAEEIRMQVLQRIDLFTDTGLREQLGARLQPIVDRASADLVATINQHVGELLRAYVAEAIEREIESWRRDD